MSQIEQRRTPRFDVDQPVVVSRTEQEYQGRMINLSLGGALIVVSMEPPPRVGDSFAIAFTVPTLEDPIEVKAQVRWRAEHDAATCGIQFTTGLRAKQTWAVGRFLDELAREADG
jgi:hypothetical protein